MSKSINKISLISTILISNLLICSNVSAFETQTNQPKVENVFVDYSVINDLKLDKNKAPEKKLLLPGLDKKENERLKKEEERRKRIKKLKEKSPKPVKKPVEEIETEKTIDTAPEKTILPKETIIPEEIVTPEIKNNNEESEINTETKPTETEESIVKKETPNTTETIKEDTAPVTTPAEDMTENTDNNQIDENYNIIKFDENSTNLTGPIVSKIDNFVNSIDNKENTYIKIVSYNFVEGDTFKSRRISLNRALSIRTYLKNKDINSNHINIKIINIRSDKSKKDLIELEKTTR